MIGLRRYSTYTMSSVSQQLQSRRCIMLSIINHNINRNAIPIAFANLALLTIQLCRCTCSHVLHRVLTSKVKRENRNLTRQSNSVSGCTRKPVSEVSELVLKANHVATSGGKQSALPAHAGHDHGHDCRLVSCLLGPGIGIATSLACLILSS